MGGVNTVHLVDPADPVPPLAAFNIVNNLAGVVTANYNAGLVFAGSGGVSPEGWFPINVHGDRPTYINIGAQFDSSTDSVWDALKEDLRATGITIRG